MNECVLCVFVQSRVLSSQQSSSLSSEDVSSEGLSSVLSVIAQAETALQLRQQEVQVGQCEIRIDPSWPYCEQFISAWFSKQKQWLYCLLS